jgi:hypothetical protein
MEGISDIYIVGFDETRPPALRKEPYIDLYFKLSHQAPEEWCKEFNDLAAKLEAKIDVAQGLIINTWVRTPADLPLQLQLLKIKVAECTVNYIKKIEQAQRKGEGTGLPGGYVDEKQVELNRIVAGLDFSP